MAWADEILRWGGAGNVCLKLECQGETRYYSDGAVHEVGTYWEPRILGLPSMPRGVDVDSGYPILSAASVTLDNADGALSELLTEDYLDGAAATIYYAAYRAGTWYLEERFSGTARLQSGDQSEIRIEILPALLGDVGYLFRQVMRDGFPNAPDGSTAGKPSTLGCTLPIVFGEAVSTKGAVRGIMVNQTAGAETFAVACHCVHAISTVYRLRANALTTLATPADYTITRFALDEQGDPYAYFKLTAGRWQEGDELYASVTGIPREWYVTLDGVNDKITATAANSPNLPGRTGIDQAFTVEYKFRRATVGSSRSFSGIWDYTAPANQRSWLDMIWFSGGNDQFYFWSSANGSAASAAVATTTLLNSTAIDYTIRRTYDPNEAALADAVRVWINGTPQVMTGAFAAPLFVTTTSNYDLGSHDGLRNPLNGRLYYCIVAAGVQPLAAGCTGDHDCPLENIISEHRMFPPYQSGATWYQHDLVGDNDLTCVSLATADYTAAAAMNNLPRMVDALLRWKWFGWRLASAKVNRASIAAVAALHTSRAWDDAGDIGGALPTSVDYLPENEETIRQICRCGLFALYPQADGRVAMCDMDLTTPSATEVTLSFGEDKGDVIDSSMSPAARLWNSGRIEYRHIQRDGGMYEAAIRAINQISIDAYGESEEAGDFTALPLVSSEGLAQDLARIYMLARSGASTALQVTAPGLNILQADVGDHALWSLRHLRGDWSGKETFVRSLDDGLWLRRPVIEVVSLETIGAVSVGGTGGGGGEIEEPFEIIASLDTYISSREPNLSYGSEHELRHGKDWWATQLEPWVPQIDYLWMWFRFDLLGGSPAPIPGGATIESCRLEFYCTWKWQNPATVARESLNRTWGGGSTLNHFENNGAGAAFNYGSHVGGTNLTTWGGISVGSISREFVSAGLSYLQARLAADGIACLAFDATSSDGDHFRAASIEHGTTSWRPRIVGTYTV